MVIHSPRSPSCEEKHSALQPQNIIFSLLKQNQVLNCSQVIKKRKLVVHLYLWVAIGCHGLPWVPLISILRNLPLGYRWVTKYNLRDLPWVTLQNIPAHPCYYNRTNFNHTNPSLGGTTIWTNFNHTYPRTMCVQYHKILLSTFGE